MNDDEPRVDEDTHRGWHIDERVKPFKSLLPSLIDQKAEQAAEEYMHENFPEDESSYQITKDAYKYAFAEKVIELIKEHYGLTEQRKNI